MAAVFGAAAALLARVEAPVLWQGLIGRALPLSVGAVVIGLAAGAALVRGADAIARILGAAGTACIFIAWGVALWPNLIVPHVTINNAASPSSVLGPTLIVALGGLVVLIPALVYLFSVVKRQALSGHPRRGVDVGATAASFVASLQPPAASTVPPHGSDSVALQATSNAVPAASLAQQIAVVLAVLPAIAAAPLVTGTFEHIRLSFQQRRHMAQRRGHAV